MSAKNSYLRESFYKNGKQSAKVSGQEVSSKQSYNYGQQKRTSHKDLSPSSGVNINPQLINNPYYFISPKINGPQESKIGQKRAQSSCRPSINNPNNLDNGSLFSVLDQFKISPQLPLNLGKSQDFQQQFLQQQQQNQPQKRKIRILRQSIGSRQATRYDEQIIDENDYINPNNVNLLNSNFMDQTPVSIKSQKRKESQQFSANNTQLVMKQSQNNNSQMQPPQINPNNVGDAYFKNSVFQANTPISIKTPSSYISGNNTTNPVIIKNNINNISVQIGNCSDNSHSFKLKNNHKKELQNENQLYDFNIEQIDSPIISSEQSDDRINTQTTNKDSMNKTCKISTNNSKLDCNGGDQEDKQTRIYALQNYLKNTSTTKFTRNSRRGNTQSTHSSNQAKTPIENNLVYSDSRQSKNSTAISNFNTNNLTRISDENQNPEYQQTIKKQLNCIQVCTPQSVNVHAHSSNSRNKSQIPQKTFSKFDQNIQILGQTDPCNSNNNKNDQILINSYLDLTIQQEQGNNSRSFNQSKMNQPTVSINQSMVQPQFPKEIGNQDVEELHFQFVEFQQKCKEWLKRIEL